MKKCLWIRASLLWSALAWPLEEEVTVHSEAADFSFVSQLSNRERMAREPAAFMPSARVIGVKRELAMSESEEDLMPQDIILNSGSEKGMVEGLMLKVMRKAPMLDPYKGNAQKEIEIELATVEIIHVQQGIAVARVVDMRDIKKRPSLAHRGILIGDYVGQ